MNQAATQSADHHEEEHHEHVSSIAQLLGIFALLIFFTFLTVAVTWVDLGPFNVWIAILIAAIKVTIVAMFYMHLKYENQFFGQILITSIFFATVMIGIILMDTRAYLPDVHDATPAATTTSP
ncbi:MAG: cytochrome C oxidase subunit IV family protein [Phycisphaeraceae bacterium]|nr:cytochrome C oxidase subunit IV family protein [Phycisphaeraceae bacterium]